MKRIVRNPFAVTVLVMIAVAVAALLTVSTIEAGGGNRCVCPQPPEDCIFLGCDPQGGCMYQC
jgi:hypothetical protein